MWINLTGANYEKVKKYLLLSLTWKKVKVIWWDWNPIKIWEKEIIISKLSYLDYENLKDNEKDEVDKAKKEWKYSVKLWWKYLEISKFDFKDLSWFNDEELLEIINVDLWIDLKNNPEWLDILNQLFIQSISIYNDTSIKKIFERKWVRDFSNWTVLFYSIEEVFTFMKEAWLESWWWNAKLKCLMMKITSSVTDILKNEPLQELDNKKEEIINKLRPILNLKEIWDSLTWNIWWKKFMIFWRAKSLFSMNDKSIWNVDYTSANSIKDPLGFTLELFEWNEIDYLELLHIIQNVIISLWWKILDSKVKWIDIKKVKNQLSNKNQHLHELIDWIKFEKKSWTSKWYIDIKSTFEIEISPKIFIKMEIKITPPNNENQDWIHFSWIYAYLSKYIEWYIIRHLENWYISVEDLSIMCEAFFENLQTLINENPEKVWTSKDEYLKELWDDFQNKEKDENWKPIIRHWIKFKNRSIEQNIWSYLLPWLIAYYKTKLIKINSIDWKEIYTNERWKALIESWYFKTQK